MNRFGLNRSSLNGVVYALVLATASISCSAEVTAVGVRDAEALSPVSSAAYVTADAQVTRYVAANLNCAGEAYPNATHTHATYANFACTAGVTIYTLRYVNASAEMVGTCQIVAIPASLLGTSSVDSSATVIAEATRVQMARSSADGVCGVEISIEPTAWRMALCTASLGVATVRAETAIKLSGESFFTNETYANVTAGAEILTAEVLDRRVVASLVCTATVSGTGNRVQPGYAAASGSGAVLIVEPATWAVCLSRPSCSAEVSADATRILVPAAVTLASSATVTLNAWQKHAASAAPSGSASIALTGLITQHGAVTMAGGATATATALRVLKPVANPSGGATVVVTALRTVEPTSSPSCAADVTADGVRRLIPGNITITSTAETTANADKLFYPASNMACSATLVADAVRVCMAGAATSGTANLYPDWRYVYIGKIAVANVSGTGALTATALRTAWADAIDLIAASELTADASRYSPPATLDFIDGSAEVTAEALRMRVGEVALGGSAEIFADTVTNPASYDPPERTFTRTGVVLEFVRPFQETEFRRVA